MLKTGEYRALRNIPVGWLLQAIHSTDKSECYFRITVEFVVLGITVCLLMADMPFAVTLVISFIIVHSIMWLATGNFWVYMLDSFYFVHNPGLNNILSFVDCVKAIFLKFDSCEAILIYGSMCRRQFHKRSDLDLRILRRTDSLKGLVALPIGLLLRCFSFFLILPVDLQVVDSMKFLRKQMRPDEKPIVVYSRDDISSLEPGVLNFSDIKRDPSIVMK